MRSRLAISLLAMAIIATAQQASVAPQPVAGPAYAKHKNHLYIYGGYRSVNDTTISYFGQFFALDLSKSWTSTSPAWSALPEGASSYGVGATVSLDGNIFMTSPIFPNPPRLFSFDTKTWSMSKATYPNTMLVAKPVTLGTDGTVLLAGGSPPASYEHHTYSFVRDQLVKEPQLEPNTLREGIPVAYEVVWSEHFKSAIIFGGFSIPVYSTAGPIYTWAGRVVFYHAEKKTWSRMEISGLNSTVARDFCLAISDDGKKLFSYGGTFDPPTEPTPLSSNLYIMDLATGVWTEVANSGLKRANAVCTVAGDYFLLWGGRDAISTVDAGKSSTPVYIYQISSNKWIQEYRPSAEYLRFDSNTPSDSAAGPASTSPPSQNPVNKPVNDEDPSAKANVGAIVGGAAGGAVVIVVVGFLVCRHKRQRAEQSRMHDSTLNIDQRSATIDKTRDGCEHGARRIPRTSLPMDTYHPRQNADYPDYASDEASDSRYYDRDGYMYPVKRNASSHASHPHYPSQGDSYVPSEPQHYGTTPMYTSDTMTSLQPIQSRSTSPPVSPYGCVLPPDSSRPSSQPTKRRLRDPHVLDHKHRVREHFYAPDGRRIEERPPPLAP